MLLYKVILIGTFNKKAFHQRWIHPLSHEMFTQQAKELIHTNVWPLLLFEGQGHYEVTHPWCQGTFDIGQRLWCWITKHSDIWRQKNQDGRRLEFNILLYVSNNFFNSIYGRWISKMAVTHVQVYRGHHFETSPLLASFCKRTLSLESINKVLLKRTLFLDYIIKVLFEKDLILGLHD